MENEFNFLIFKKINPMGLIEHSCDPRYSGGQSRRILTPMPAWAKVAETLFQKQHKNKRGRGHSSSARVFNWHAQGRSWVQFPVLLQEIKNCNYNF
jgi:hypothetical protein